MVEKYVIPNHYPCTYTNTTSTPILSYPFPSLIVGGGGGGV